MRALALGLTFALLGCEANILSPAPKVEEPTTSDPTVPGGEVNLDTKRFACATPRAPASPLTRLTLREEDTSLLQLLCAAGLDDMRYRSLRAQVPSDARPGFDQPGPLNQDLANLQLDIALALGERIVATASLRAALLPSCAAAGRTPDTACVDQLLAGFGARVFRRPLDAAELAWHRGTFMGAPGTSDEKLSALLAGLVASPAFHYHLELDGTDVAADAYRLSAYGYAARLSFLLWGSTPDAALLAAAGSGALDTEDGARAEVNRLLADPRARAHFGHAFDKWLHLSDTPQLRYPDAVLQGLQLAGLREAMITEALDFANHVTFDARGGWPELMTSSASVVRNAELARLYGVTPDAQTGAVTFGSGRAGLLGKAIVLARAGTYSASIPVKRGVFVLQQLLCQPLKRPDPTTLPPGALDPFTVDPGHSLRDVITARTGQGVCWGCHRQINPPGFALEGFDALGRARQTEVVLDEATGAELNRVPVNDATELDLGGGAKPIRGEAELAQALAGSGQARGCFVQSIYQATRHRPFDDDAQCTASEMEDALRGGDVHRMLEAAALSPLLRLRKWEP